MSDKTVDPSAKAGGAHTAGAFDIRNIIGSLLGIYGVLLVLAGLFMDTEEEKTGGVNANLWTGLALLGVGGAFLLWARIKPFIVPPRRRARRGRPNPSGPAAAPQRPLSRDHAHD
jgi:hypothetical protein